MFADKVSSLPESEVHERCSAKKGSAGKKVLKRGVNWPFCQPLKETEFP